MKRFAETLETPRYAAVFPWSRNDNGELDGRVRAAQEMMALASRQPGCLGVETARGSKGPSMVISYWRDLDAFDAWRAKGDDAAARRRGRDAWCDLSGFRVSRVKPPLGQGGLRSLRRLSGAGWDRLATLLALWHLS
jgi:heme-degrading monooxygenase HmoA